MLFHLRHLLTVPLRLHQATSLHRLLLVLSVVQLNRDGLDLRILTGTSNYDSFDALHTLIRFMLLTNQAYERCVNSGFMTFRKRL